MALENLIGQEAHENIRGKPFGINPDSDYNREEFIKRAGDLFDVYDYYSKLRENINDVDALNDLIAIAVQYIPGNPKLNTVNLQENPHLVLEQGDALSSAGSTAMSKFVENNRSKILGKLSAKQLYNLFLRAPSYQTNDKEHDRKVALRNKVLAMQEASKKGEDLGSVVEKETQELIEGAPKEQQMYILKNAHLVIPVLRQAILEEIQKSFSKLFKDEEGNLNKAELLNYLERNYKVAEDFIENIPSDNQKERDDYWDKNLKPQYLELARELYSSEKKEYKQEKNPDKENRKTAAKELGLSA